MDVFQLGRADRGVMKDESRFRRVYETHSQDVYRLAIAITGDPDIAADLVQTAFLRLFARFRDVRHPEATYAYLRQTIVNLTRDGARRESKERKTLALLESREHVLEATNQASAPAVGSDVIDLINLLPQRQRTVLALRYFEDLSEADAASLMGLSVSATKALTHRAISTLRTQLGETE